MKLSELVGKLQPDTFRLSGNAKVTGAALDSRIVKPGDAFVAMPGGSQDSVTFIQPAIGAGASGVIVADERGWLAAGDHPKLLLTDFRNQLWRVLDLLYGHPTRSMKVIGVTGTNGKTTTAWGLRQALSALGYRSAYLGTLGFTLPSGHTELSNTTPFAVELYALLARARDEGVTALAIEVSSHALAQGRAHGIELDVGTFTNFSRDHLDFHRTMEEYEAAKWAMFTELPALSPKAFTGVFNTGDEVGHKFWDRFCAGPKLGFQVGDGHPGAGELRVFPVETSLNASVLRLRFAGEERIVRSRLLGLFNVENLGSIAASLLGLGHSLGEIASATEPIEPVPGRFETIAGGGEISVIVDYAHTADGLKKLLEAARPLTRGRLITVFGCGGDRDAGKRPEMGKIAAGLSDLCVLTSDNPRTEDPERILEEIAAGMVGAAFERLLDRKAAIRRAIELARPGDTVVIAGKGHEDYQIIDRTKFPMDDRKLAREALKQR